MKTALERKLQASLRTLAVPSGEPIAVGVSGGADSIALADAVGRCHSGSIAIAHLNHLIRGEESDADAGFVEAFAKGLGLQFVCERIDVPHAATSSDRNLEAVAREVRYDFLSRAAQQVGAHLVCTAHTRDDQIETILMRIIRGTGPEGLRGIYSRRELNGDTELIRPLLEVSRNEVLEHCEQRGLVFRSDSSNADLEFMRNRVRLELLPHLRSFNPRLDEALLRMSGFVAEDDEKLTLDAEKVLDESIGEEYSLKLGPVCRSHVAIRRRVLRIWLRNARGHLQRIDGVHLAAVERLMLEGETGKRIELPGGHAVVKKHQSLVIVGPEVT
jgi:tRNA(Ile)-lysidine synthase